ncbi:MAG: ABC transporter permease [Vicinamibacterales bacterium]
MLLQDLRHGLRLLIRRPAFAVVAVVTLALGIGANTAIFAVVDRALLRPLRVPEPDRLVAVWETSPNIPLPIMYASPPNLAEWRARARSFEALGGFSRRSLTVGGTDPEQVPGAWVTAGLLEALGVQPRLGRLFRPEEDRANAPAVALLSDGLWRRRFAADPAVLGTTVAIDGRPTTIVGVMPPGFECPPPITLNGPPPAERAELWIPHGTDLEAGQRGAHYLGVVGRLRPGVTVEAAAREVDAIQAQIEQEHPDYRDWRAVVHPLTEEVTAASRRSMLLLSLAVGFMLLLASANVANLLLARGVGRRREFAVRTALGASRARLARQVIVESLALAITGGAAGVLLAAALVRIIARFGPATVPGLREVALDPRALAFAVVVSMAAAILAGLAPALRVVRAGLRDWLNERGAAPGSGGLRLQQGLVVGQVALAMGLLVTAGLLVESFRALRGVDPGFQPDHVVTGRVNLPAARYVDGAARTQFLERLLTDARRLPGLSAVGASEAIPLADNRQGTEFWRDDRPAPDAEARPHSNVAWITEGYFDALGMPVLAGRGIEARDVAGSPRVLVVNRRLATMIFGDEDPLGRPVRIGNASGVFEVVGVVGDDRHSGLDVEPTPTFFVSLRQVPAFREIALVARAEEAPEAALGALGGTIRRLDPALPFFDTRSMASVVDESMATPRSLAWLLSGLASSGLLLAAIGVFGVLSHAVSQRTQEIGVRMAIGASPAQVLGMVVGQGMLQVGVGILVGLALAAATGRLLSGLLFGVSAADPMPYVVVALLLVAAGAIACLVPARRAMRVDPAVALRAD